MFQKAQKSYEDGRIDAAIEQADKALTEKNLKHSQKVEIAAFLGQCYLKSSSYRDIYLNLRQKIKYIKRLPSAPASFSLYRTYLEALIVLDLKKEAEEELERWPLFFKKVKDDVQWAKRYLAIKKLKYLFAQKYEDKKRSCFILEAIYELAKFVDHPEEMEFAQRKLDDETIEASQVNYFSDWVYLKEDQLALFPKTKKISNLKQNGPIQNIVHLLLPGPLQTEEFFKAVTNKTYEDERHQKYLEQILNKSRVMLSENSIHVQGGSIALF